MSKHCLDHVSAGRYGDAVWGSGAGVGGEARVVEIRKTLKTLASKQNPHNSYDVCDNVFTASPNINLDITSTA